MQSAFFAFFFDKLTHVVPPWVNCWMYESEYYLAGRKTQENDMCSHVEVTTE
ncbi:hypothetical protein SYK_16590 [Pseudodesulfovibrio nedwellii]|uniref:Uncharacterized protein n=1 Tax=Pseudodesulfovibrio nedwellii TaxID=2973072 RepID=A0ABM8B0L9_9BACT|nr:hypothetical protein SYK_16590 [Pseudodesulfovibrio nedwellii]